MTKPVEWIWWGRDETDKEHVSFGRWQRHPCQSRYKLAEVQPTEHDHPSLEPQASNAGAGIYVASKTRHAAAWKAYRERGWPINSTWIDEAGVGESGDLNDLWRRCIGEASSAAVLVVYREPDDVLKGGWVEVGAALAAGVPVYAVGINGFTIAHDKRIRHFETLDDAMDAAARTAALSGPIRSKLGDLRLEPSFVAFEAVCKPTVLCSAEPNSSPEPQAAEAVLAITGMDEYGPMMGWYKPWTDFEIGTLFVVLAPKPKVEERV